MTQRTPRREILRTLPLALVCFMAGCEPIRWELPGRDGPAAAALDVWAVGDMVALTDRTARVEDEPLYDAAAKAVSLHAAANETVSFQLVFDAGPDGAKGVRLAWGDLSGPDRQKLPAGRIRAFRMLPLAVREVPAWYLRLVAEPPVPAGRYDPLVPLDVSGSATPLDVDANGRLAVWVDVSVPRDAPAGRYQGTLGVSADGREDWAATLKLDVHAFVLPDARPVPAIGGFDHHELFGALIARDGKPFRPVYLDRDNPHVRRGLVLMRQLMRMAHDHRLDLFDRRIRPVMKRAGDEGVKLLWDDYDAVVAPYLSGTAFDDRIGCAAWPVPVYEDWPSPQPYGGRSSPRYAQTVSAVLDACREHFAKNLRAGRQAFHWPCRGRVGSETYARHRALAGLARKHDPNTPILCALPPSAPAGAPWRVPGDLRAFADILAPRGNLLDPSLAASAPRAGHPLKGVWLAPATPPYLPSLGVIAGAADARAFVWLAMKYRCSGLFLPDVLHWASDPFAPVAGSETRLFYPGTIAGLAQPLPSVRLKRLRRGLQDIAYLWILRKRQREGVLGAAMNSLVWYGALAACGDNYLDPRLGGWERDGATWALARRILAEEVQAVVSAAHAPRTSSLAHRLNWRRLEERTRRLAVEQVRSVVRPAGGQNAPASKTLRLTVLVDLFNRHGREASVRADFAKLPKGWKSLVPPGRSTKIPPVTAAVLRLEAEGPAPLPVAGDAKAPMPIRLTSNVEGERRIPAAVGFLVVGRTKTPPTIDGLLDDWPLRASNTARGFRLIGRRGRTGDGLAKRQTMAFCLRDDKTLYLAFRCEEPNLPGMVKKPSNRVHYEQLIASGEDLVEVLFDPGGKVTGPEGLYHLIIKPNGVLVSERGVRSDPALGRVRPWAPFASVAIAERPGAWTAELAIPLAAFGDGANEALWRVNFTRFATQGAEASSWSGAPRYFYDPRNLGTMLMGPAAGGP